MTATPHTHIDVRSGAGVSRRVALAQLSLAGIVAALAANPGRTATAQPASPEAGQKDANTFSLRGSDTRIDLTVGSESGETSLTYDGPDGSQTCTGEDLTVEVSALGRLVTCMIGAFPDRGELWVTLLLPRLNPVDPGAEPTPFSTLAILRWEISTIAGPPREGALDSFEAVPLDGTAEYRAS